MKRERGLPLLAGALLALAYPPARLLVPAFVGLVPLLLFIARRPPGPRGRWDATRAGLLTGAVYFGLQLYWLGIALGPYSLLALPAYLGMVAVLAALVGAFAWALHYTRERLDVPLPLLTAALWTTLEWGQAHLGDLAFPWLGLGTALAPFPILAGAADLVGTRGLTFWIAGVNGLLASAMLRQRAGRPVAPALAMLLAVLVLPTAYGAARAVTLATRPAARVAVVQPNISEEVKLGPLGLDFSITALANLTLSLAGEPLDLVAWPEMALPTNLAGDPGLQDAIRALSARVGAPILVGAYGVYGDDDPAAHNSAFLIDARPSPDPERYDKRRLVPFIERVPFVGTRPRGGGEGPPEPGAGAGPTTRRPPFGSLSSGRSGTVFELEPATFGTLICYESIFAPLARSYRSRGADFLVNITNDAWYGRDRWWGRTTALWQHPAHLVLRAIETRTGVARAANTGFSLFVDPLGRVQGRTPLFEPAVSMATIHTTPGTTLFVRRGDWLATLALLFTLAALLAARVRRR